MHRSNFSAAVLLLAVANPSISAFAPPRAGGHPFIHRFKCNNNSVSKTRLQDTEELASVLERAECSTYPVPSEPSTKTASSSNKNNKDDEDDIITNGTAERVQQNPLGKFADAASASVFAALHFNDKLKIKDSSKNLRVLWSRAYLNHVGMMKDEIAYQLLPESTRDIIHLLPKNGPLVNFQEFITSRTEFIDGAVESFLRGVDEITTAGEDGEKTKPQIVLFGAGYDTRSLRYNDKATFFEIDLPDIVEGKGRLQSYWKDLQKSQNKQDADITLPTRIGYDLNDAALADTKPSLTQVLTDAGLRRDVPTLFGEFHCIYYFYNLTHFIGHSFYSFSLGGCSLLCQA